MSRLLASALALSLFGCGGFVIGNGKLQTRTVELPAYSTLEVESAIEVDATIGPPSFSISADQNVMPFVETFVRDGVLVLRVQDGVMLDRATIRAVVSNDRFEGVSASGASRVTAPMTPTATIRLAASGASTLRLSGLESAVVQLEAAGASTITLSGQATSASLRASGASNVNGMGLFLESATVDVAGASTVRARVSKSISGDVSGASTLEVAGSPAQMNVIATGASTVRRSAE